MTPTPKEAAKLGEIEAKAAKSLQAAEDLTEAVASVQGQWPHLRQSVHDLAAAAQAFDRQARIARQEWNAFERRTKEAR